MSNLLTKTYTLTNGEILIVAVAIVWLIVLVRGLTTASVVKKDLCALIRACLIAVLVVLAIFAK